MRMLLTSLFILILFLLVLSSHRHAVSQGCPCWPRGVESLVIDDADEISCVITDTTTTLRMRRNDSCQTGRDLSANPESCSVFNIFGTSSFCSGTASSGFDLDMICKGQLDEFCDALGILVEIDIKPGSDTNPINPDSMGLVPVAILGSDDFDVMEIDPTTLAFGPDGAGTVHDLIEPVTYADHLKDVNGDGFIDLMSHYLQKETGLAPGHTEACLSGKTNGGIDFEGCDAVTIIGS